MSEENEAEHLNEILRRCPMCGTLFDQVDQTVCPIDGVTLEDVEDEQETTLTGQVVAGRFEVGELLGAGGMGAVYKARQISIDRDCALKILKKEIVDNKTAVKRFLLEAKATSRLTNAHTITIYDFGQTETGELFIAMEFLKGKDLKDKLAQSGPLPIARAVEVITGVALSLGEAHSINIVHRDLKPANIFLAEQASDPEFVKVLDFGIARAKDMTDGMTMTQTGTVAGTPGYMAPETIMGKKVDARADVYALGVILYELLCGEKVFAGDTPIMVMTSHISQQPLSLLERMPEGQVPLPLSNFVERCLAKDPDNRPSDAEAFRRELEQVWAQCDSAALEAAGTDDTFMAAAPLTQPAQVDNGGGTHPSVSTQMGNPLAGGAVGTDDTMAAMAPGALQIRDTSTSADQVVPTTETSDESSGDSSGSKAVPIAIAAVLLLGIGGFFAMSGGGDAPEKAPQSAKIESAATPAEPKAPEPKPAKALMKTVEEVKAAPAPKPAAAASAPEAAPAKAAAPVEVAKPAPAPEIVLSLVSQPAGAKVFLGETELGKTPLTKRLKQADDVLKLELKKSGYHTKSVELTPSKDQVLSVKLKSSKRRNQKAKAASKPAPKPKAAPKPKPKPKKPKSLHQDLLD